MAFPTIFRGVPIGRASVHEAGDPFGSIDHVFDNVWRGLGAPAAAAASGFVPRLDVVERENEYLLTAELPGLEEKDFALEVHGNLLTLSGEKRAEHEEVRKGWRWNERAYGAFRRSVELPVEVASDKASATFRNGVLTVTVPKAESARVRQIPVTPG